MGWVSYLRYNDQRSKCLSMTLHLLNLTLYNIVLYPWSYSHDNYFRICFTPLYHTWHTMAHTFLKVQNSLFFFLTALNTGGSWSIWISQLVACICRRSSSSFYSRCEPNFDGHDFGCVSYNMSFFLRLVQWNIYL